MDLTSLLDLAKRSDSLLAIPIAGAIVLIVAVINQIAPIMEQARLWEAGRRSAIENRNSASTRSTKTSKMPTKRPSMVILPVSSVILSALVILVAMDSQPVVGARLLLVLAATGVASASLALSLVLPLVLLLADAVRALRDWRGED